MIDYRTHKRHSIYIDTSRWYTYTLSEIIEELVEAQKKLPENRVQEDLYFNVDEDYFDEISVSYYLPKTQEDFEEEEKSLKAFEDRRVEQFRKLELELKKKGLI